MSEFALAGSAASEKFEKASELRLTEGKLCKGATESASLVAIVDVGGDLMFSTNLAGSLLHARAMLWVRCLSKSSLLR